MTISSINLSPTLTKFYASLIVILSLHLSWPPRLWWLLFSVSRFFRMIFTSDSFICGGECHRPWHYGGKHSWYGARMGGPKYYAINLILRLFLYRFLHALSSESIHNNTNTQQTSPPWWWSHLPLQRRWFYDFMLPEGRAALHIYCPRPLLKDLNRLIKLK